MGFIDNSIQLRTSNLNSNILYNIQPTSNTFTLLSLFNSSNVFFSNQLLLKQNNLNSSNVLLGIGSNITALDYTKITLNKPTNFQADWNSTIINKPTNFQADWNSTIINKPSIYNQTEVNNLLSAKEAVLTFNAPLTRSTNTIGINLNSYVPFTAISQSNYVNFSQLLSSNYTPFTALQQSNYATYTALNTCNYLQKSGGTITGDINVNANITTQQLYINNQNSTASIIFSPNPSIYSIFSRKVPWAMYFAEDYNSSSPTVLPNYISNSRDAELTGTITKTTGSGNGATGNITYISGGIGATISFPAGSIPSTFTILGLMRYTNASANQARILTSSSGNWLLGYNTTNEGTGIAFFNGWRTAQNLAVLTNKTDWLCMIAKNVGATPNNIIANGTGVGNATGGDGGGSYRLAINNDLYGSITKSDWALSCVMIWDTALTDAEMLDLNTIINTYKNDGVSIKSLISSTIDDDSIIESRVYSGFEKTELLLFKGNDGTGTNGADRIRLKAGNIAFDTYSSLTPSSSRNNENIVMLINENGNVGIGTTTNLTYKLNINGSLNATSVNSNGLLIDFNSYSTNSNLTSNYYNKTTSDARYLKLSGGSLTGNVYGNDILLSVNKGSFNRIDTLKTANVNVPGVGDEGPLTGGEKILLGYGTPTTHPYSIGLNTNVQWYSVPTGATQIFYIGGTEITTISSSGVGIGATNGSYKLNVNGSFNATSINSNGTLIDFSSYSTNSNLTTNYYNKITTDNLLNAKDAILSFTSPLVRTLNSITFNESSITTLTNFYNKSNADARYLQLSGGTLTGSLNLNTANTFISLGSRVENYLIKLWGDDYGFGINSGMLRYNSAGNHTFFCAGTQRAQINSTGLSITGEISSSGYLYGNLLRISGNDQSNSLYNGARDMGLTVDNGKKITLGVWTGSATTYIIEANNTSVSINKQLNCYGITNTGAVNFNGASEFNCYGPALFDYSIRCRLDTTTSRDPHDYVGVPYETASGAEGVYTLYLILNSFTGLHRSFTNDELFDENEPQLFKDTYEGRIVIATGKIATQIGNQKDGYEIKYDKEGIYVEDAHPLIELSRKKKDKRVFGVLGRRDRKNSNEKRMIINSIGEGGIWICNSNGNFENGDIITTSNYLGFGERQDDDILHNYSVGKITIDCDFQLDSLLYECKEIDDLDANGNKLRVAFVGCVYYAG